MTSGKVVTGGPWAIHLASLLATTDIVLEIHNWASLHPLTPSVSSAQISSTSFRDRSAPGLQMLPNYKGLDPTTAKDGLHGLLKQCCFHTSKY